MTIVEYTKSHNGYNAGERAGYSEDQAERLVKRGVAVIVSENVKSRAPESRQLVNEREDFAAFKRDTAIKSSDAVRK